MQWSRVLRGPMGRSSVLDPVMAAARVQSCGGGERATGNRKRQRPEEPEINGEE